MHTNEEIIYEYEQILLGRKQKYIYSFVGADTQKERAAGIILNYAITKILRWTPEMAKANLTFTIIKDLQLEPVIKNLGIKAKKLDSLCVQKILSAAFPDDVHFNFDKQTIEIYKQLIGLDPENSLSECPKGFFSDEDGLRRAAVCLIYAISISLYSKTARELYDFFASSECESWLDKMKLANNAKRLYDSPLDYFHYSIPIKNRNYIYYYNDKIAQICKLKKASA